MRLQSSLVSLHDMLLTYAHAFALLTGCIEQTRGKLSVLTYAGEVKTLEPDSVVIQQLSGHLQTFVATCQQTVDLERMLSPVGRIMLDISGPEIHVGRLNHDLEHLQLQMFDELSRQLYYHVPGSFVPLYNDPQPFGPKVADGFPSAGDDIRFAGRCIALGQPTAAVFHMMLVLEVGLAALAKALKIAYAPSWESYLREINKRINAKYDTKKAAWRKDEAFYRDIVSDLQIVKVAWRNPTMHIVRGRSYSMEDALSIYYGTRTLMARLAERFKEPRQLAAASVGVVAPQEEPSEG